MAIKLQVRRGTASDWNAVSGTVTLLSGEIGYETDTGNFKIGDNSTLWGSLPYVLSTYPQATVSGTDINASGYLAQGRYLVTTSVTSNVPSGWTPATDGPGVLTTTKLADGKVMQMLVSTTTQKAFLRGYAPTTYTTWVAISQHAGSITATELASSAVETAKINDNAVTFAKIQDITGLSVVGKGNSGLGDPTVITATASGQVLRHDGTNISFGTLASTAFDGNTDIPLTALANQAANTLVGNVTGSSAAPTAVSQASARTFLGLNALAYLNRSDLVTVNTSAFNASPGTTLVTFDLSSVAVGEIAYLEGSITLDTSATTCTVRIDGDAGERYVVIGIMKISGTATVTMLQSNGYIGIGNANVNMFSVSGVSSGTAQVGLALIRFS